MGRRKNKFGDEQSQIKKKPHVDRLVLVTREEWGARESKESLPPVVVPVHNVVLTWTDTDICEWPEACKKTILGVQQDHMDNLGLPDIRYNFLIGTDKQVYEGRGWGMAGPTYPDTIAGAEEINGKSIEIAFIDKNMTEPSVDLAETVIKFLARELTLDTKNITKPVEFKGIMDNKFVKFGRIFRGEVYFDFMRDEEEKAQAAEWDRLAKEYIQQRQPIIEARKEANRKLVEELLAEQRATIQGKTPEEVHKEYGFTESLDQASITAAIEKYKDELDESKWAANTAAAPEGQT